MRAGGATPTPEGVREASTDVGNIPEELRNRDQWVAFRYEYRASGGKPKKAPINPRTGHMTDPTNPGSWGTLDEALRAVERYGLDGVGFALTEDDPYIGADLDEAIDPDTGELRRWAAKIIEKFGSYSEISPSGRGIRIIVRGRLPGEGTHKKSIGLFDRSCYVTITGRALVSTNEIEDRQEQIESLYRKVKPETIPLATSTPTVPVDMADRELLAKARSAKNGEKFIKLYHRGDITGFPSPSEADMSLLLQLAFWTGRDPERIDRLFRSSALMRPKWEQAGYRERTLRRAISRCENVYNPEPPGATSEAKEILADLEQVAGALPWEGRGGPTDRHVYGDLINTGGGWGKVTERGIPVAVSTRDTALNVGTSARTVATSFQRLQERGLIEDLVPGKGRRATRLTLLKPSHIALSSPPTCVLYVKARGAELLAKLRNPAPEMPEYDRHGRRISQSGEYLVRSIGKTRALILERVVCSDGLTLPEISESLSRRADNLARLMPMLVSSGLLVEDGDVYRAAPGWEDRLERELEESGCNAAEKRDRRRYEADRAAYHNPSMPVQASQAPDERPSANPEEFTKLASMIRDGITRARAEKPSPRRFGWGVDPNKESFYFPKRTANRNPSCAGVRAQAVETRTLGSINRAV